MNIEDIKIGETYNVRMLVAKIDEDGWIKVRTDENRLPCLLAPYEADAFTPLPKYDPNRLFRRGDKVRMVEWNGRNYYDLDHCTKLETGCLAEIWEDEEAEQQEGYVSVIYQGYIRSVPPCYLELVTPVEELETAAIFDDIKTGMWVVTKDNFIHAYFPYRIEISDNIANGKQEAKAAAEAECARLNAEYRKERENG